jgi:hypothetical protein
LAAAKPSILPNWPPPKMPTLKSGESISFMVLSNAWLRLNFTRNTSFLLKLSPRIAQNRFILPKSDAKNYFPIFFEGFE